MAMNYSNVGTPAFYIPWFDWRQSIGDIHPKPSKYGDIHLLNPSKPHVWEVAQAEDVRTDFYFRRDVEETGLDGDPSSGVYGSDGFAYVFALGHNFEDMGRAITIKFHDDAHPTPGSNVPESSPSDDTIAPIEQTRTDYAETGRVEIINDNGATSAVSQNGFSIYKCKWSWTASSGFSIMIADVNGNTAGDLILGNISLCTKWSPPHNPDLRLSMTREFDGVKNIETAGGNTLSHAKYTQSAWFAGGIPAWEIGGGSLGSNVYNQSRHLGRRSWNLQFSFVSDSDLMPKSESWYYYGFHDASGTASNSVLNGQTINTSDTFFAQVLNRVQGSHLPFIFQPDDSNNNADQWAICRFDQDEFSIEQVAPNVYNLSLKIRECW